MTPDTARQAIEQAFEEEGGESHILLFRIPDESYFDRVLDTLTVPVERGYTGVYVSFQRPYKNLVDRLGEADIDVSNLQFVDLTEPITGMDAAERETEECSFLPPDAPADQITRAIFRRLTGLESEHRFVFIDSLSTITIHRPLSETLQLIEFLHKRLERLDLENIILVFSVAQGLEKEDFLRDIALEEDDVVEVSL